MSDWYEIKKLRDELAELQARIESLETTLIGKSILSHGDLPHSEAAKRLRQVAERGKRKRENDTLLSYYRERHESHSTPHTPVPPFTVYGRDMFEGETYECGKFETLREAEYYVSKKRPNGSSYDISDHYWVEDARGKRVTEPTVPNWGK